MKRRELLVAMASLAGCAPQRRPRLNVFNWSNYVGTDTIPGFEKESGIEVRYSIYESNEEMLAKVFGGNSGWDVVFPACNIVGPMRESGLIAPLQHRWLDQLGNLEERFQHPPWDRNLDWCVPYMWGATGILYNKKLQPAPEAWADLWDERLRGRMTMLDDPTDSIGAGLMKLGLPLNSVEPDHLDQAKLALLRQKRLVRAYLNAEARDQMVSGDLLASQMWATTAQQAMEASGELAFAYPSEGFPVYADCGVILRESQRKQSAHRFLNYLSRGDVACAAASECKAATANAKARLLLPEALRNNEVLYPPETVLKRGEWVEALAAAGQRKRDRIWTEIKSG
ncbi:MAG: spermidine/putrescine ABC transporter substrate-binding protein [Acidobacteriia bacterium]|nr:spermidine/putrescine ABC transporter substrate-binding protein [Terriglobia bacterium]